MIRSLAPGATPWLAPSGNILSAVEPLYPLKRLHPSLLRRGFGLSKKAGNVCQKSRPIVQNTGGREEFVRNLLIVISLLRRGFNELYMAFTVSEPLLQSVSK